MAAGPGYYDPDTGAWIIGESDLATPGGLFSELINKVTRSMTAFFTAARDEAEDAADRAEAAASTVTIASDTLRPSLRGVELWTYGHSFLAEGAGQVSSTAMYYARQFATFFGMTYPTATDGTSLKRAVGGSRVEEQEQVMLGSNPYPNGRRGVVLIQALLNSLGYHPAGTATALASARDALKTMVVIASSSRRIEQSDTTVFTKGGTGWTTSTGSSVSSGSSHDSTTTQNDYMDITLPSRLGAAGRHHVIVTGKNTTAGNGPRIQISVPATGVILGVLDLSQQMTPGDTPASVHVAIPLLTADGSVVRLKKVDSGTASLLVDCLLVPDPSPVPVIGMKEPYLLDYSASTAFPYRSDAQIDTFNALWDDLATQYANIIVANPNAAAYWNKATDIGADKVHPNDSGNKHLAQCARDALVGQLLGRSSFLTPTTPVPRIDTLAAATVFDSFDRTDSGTVGSPEVGGSAWAAYPSGDQSLWSISGGRLRLAAGTTGTHIITTSSGMSDAVVTAVLYSSLSAQQGLSVRESADGTSSLVVRRATDGTWRIDSRTNTTFTNLYTSVGVSGAPLGVGRDTVRVTLNGTSVAVEVNGTNLTTLTSTFNQTATRAGFWAQGTVVTTFDSFGVYPIA